MKEENSAIWTSLGVTLVQFALTSLDANGKIPKTSFQKVDIQIRRDDIGLIRQVLYICYVPNYSFQKMTGNTVVYVKISRDVLENKKNEK